MRRLLDHTADLRAEIEAPDLDALHAEAAALVRETLVGDSPVAGRVERRLAREGEDDAERFFRFVRELVYLFDAEGFLPSSARIEGDEVVVAGERFEPARHVAERQVKALTRHRFRFESGPGGARAELVFDL
ncbi:MAG: archease [Thermoanaerobaculia bacterium]|nr:MAG: archease [Thermoanaerobaculia bacterium]